MLRKIRKIVAILSLALITLLFVDFTGAVHVYLGWLAKIQLIPALFALNFAVIAALLILTLLFGRLYCSVICPLGLFQDGVAKVGRRGKKKPYSYSKAKSVLRYVALALYIIAAVVGLSVVVSLFDPYAAFGRMANTLLQPIWMAGNNLLAHIAERADSYAFYSVEVWSRSLWLLGISIITLLGVGYLAWRNGRTYCNTICPVGTLLGAISRFSLFKIRIDSEKCNKCGLCAINCKAACIDSKNYTVDASRCVSCMNCIDRCDKKHAISFSMPTKKSEPKVDATDESTTNGRRDFLASTILMLFAASKAKAQVLPKVVEMKVDGGLADIIDKESPKRGTPITPPGSQSARNMNRNCTACQLCVSACPNGVLKPSTSLDNFMQPTMSFVDGYCRPECVSCSNVCPSGAINKIDRAEKSATQIGHAEWNESLCVVVQKGDSCSNCFRHCPVQAITMVDMGHKHPTPVIDVERCIGCGACENLCPARPVSAIHVEGHTVHRTV